MAGNSKGRSYEYNYTLIMIKIEDTSYHCLPNFIFEFTGNSLFFEILLLPE